MIHPSARLLLLLLLTCPAGFCAGETEQSGTKEDTSYGPSSVDIDGVDTVTVGIPYGYYCSADCNPGCQFSWTWGNQTSTGSQMSLQLKHMLPTQNLTCTAVNPATGKSASVHKMLRVTAGPSNIQISGPPMLTIGAGSNFTCSADCFPSCSYSWTVVLQGETFSSAQGSSISVTPPASTVVSETLICEAQNSVSQLYISTSLFLWVASISDVSIAGASTVTMGRPYTFTCLFACIPSCTCTWRYMGKTFQGDQVELPIMHQGDRAKFVSHLQITVSGDTKSEPLTCVVTNSASHASVSSTVNLTVIDPVSVRPTSEALPVSGRSFSLQCVGSQNPVSIVWLKNQIPVPASDRVRFSADNITMTLSPLLRTDDGSYQCEVAEGGGSITSVVYEMQVNYGPDEVTIVRPDEGAVGEEIFAQLGSTTELQCLSDCLPSCSIAWFYRGKLLATNASILFTPVTPPQEAALTCVAFNAVTQRNRTAETTVVVPDGPKNVIIEGPDSLEIGVTASFACAADCIPACSFTWTLYGTIVTGSEVDITVNRHISKESISCTAENTLTGKTAMVNETLSVSDPHWCGC